MKLRLRSHETKETLKLELPDNSTLLHLRQLISGDSPPSSVHLSLNRKDELLDSSPDESLLSLGVTSGDLVYFSRDAFAFQQQQTLFHGSNEGSSTSNAKSGEGETLGQGSDQNRAIESGNDGNPNLNFSSNVENEQNLDIDVEETLVEEEIEAMDIDSVAVEIGKRLDEPYFLKKVLKNELPDDDSDENGMSQMNLLVIAVHAVMLESGFVLLDNVSGLQSERLSLSRELHSVTLSYTLPELVVVGGENVIMESVCLKFQSLSHFMNVNGCLGKGRGSVYRMYLDKRRFVPAIDMVVANIKGDGEGSSNLENQVFEFWKMVKDSLALPMLIDLCDKTGLSLPPCLMRLPTELKLKILESLPGVDIARMACVCPEMRYLTSNNDLWKLKCSEEFGSEGVVAGVVRWKERFVFCWENRKKLNTAIVPRRRHPFLRRPYPRIRQDPEPFGFPLGIVGGDYDRLPGLAPFPFGQRRQVFPPIQRRNFFPNCNLGGFNA